MAVSNRRSESFGTVAKNLCLDCNSLFVNLYSGFHVRLYRLALEILLLLNNRYVNLLPTTIIERANF